MNAVVLPDVEIGDNAVVEIGSVVMPGTRIPPGERWRGNPARKWMLA
jgi:carbonic anhydrase/acetyltransferase-like protein (isoleucine patch superfamily)